MSGKVWGEEGGYGIFFGRYEGVVDDEEGMERVFGVGFGGVCMGIIRCLGRFYFYFFGVVGGLGRRGESWKLKVGIWNLEVGM